MVDDFNSQSNDIQFVEDMQASERKSVTSPFKVNFMLPFSKICGKKKRLQIIR